MTDSEPRQQFEERVRHLCEQEDYDGAVTLLLERYGGELLGFMTGRLHDETAACEVFSMMAENLWRGLAAFQWRSSAREYAYAIARNAIAGYLRAPERRSDRNIPLSQANHISRLVDRVRTRTLPHMRTEIKDKIRLLREQLAPDDQDLLILRVDRDFSWREVAYVMRGDQTPLEGEALKRETARLRQRFHHIKEQLGELAREAGLLPLEPEPEP